jgi:hypothetical protein
MFKKYVQSRGFISFLLHLVEGEIQRSRRVRAFLVTFEVGGEPSGPLLTVDGPLLKVVLSLGLGCENWA